MELTNHACVVVEDNEDGSIIGSFRFADGRTGSQRYVTFGEIRRHMRALGAESVEIVRNW